MSFNVTKNQSLMRIKTESVNSRLHSDQMLIYVPLWTDEWILANVSDASPACADTGVG